MGIWVLFFLGFMSSAQGPSCAALFELPSDPLGAFRESTEKINPQLLAEVTNLPELYMSLLREDRRINETREPLSEDLAAWVRKNFSDRYLVPDNPRDVKLFYSNSLMSLYSRVAWEYKKQIIESLAGRPVSGDLLQITQALMDSYFGARGFTDRISTPENVREFFESRPWETMPWKDVVTVLEKWLASPESERGFTAFYKWYEAQKDIPVLSFDHLQRIYMSIMKKPSPVICCKSSYACNICPHNRAWLKKASH